MSRGPGRLQHAILALVASDEDGAWTTADLAGVIYSGTNRAEKKHRVALIRALLNTTLPEQWSIVRANQKGGQFILFNRLSVASTAKRIWLSNRPEMPFPEYAVGWRTHDDAAKKVEEYRRYYEADELGRINIDIETQKQAAQICAAAGWRSGLSRAGEAVKRLMARRDELSVSRAQTFPSGNT